MGTKPNTSPAHPKGDEEGTWEQFCSLTPLYAADGVTHLVFRNRQKRGLRVMRPRDFGRLAELWGPAGPEAELKNFRAPRHREATLQLSRATSGLHPDRACALDE